MQTCQDWGGLKEAPVFISDVRLFWSWVAGCYTQPCLLKALVHLQSKKLIKHQIKATYKLISLISAGHCVHGGNAD